MEKIIMHSSASYKTEPVPDVTNVTNPVTSKRACFAILWLKGTPRDKYEQEILERLKTIEGMNAAKFSEHKQNILMVEYNPKQTKALEIINVIRRDRAQAVQVGC